MLVTCMNLYIIDFAVFDAIGCCRREKELFITNLPMAKVLLDHGPVVELAGVVDVDLVAVGGRLQIRSNPGQGTTIKVALPLSSS